MQPARSATTATTATTTAAGRATATAAGDATATAPGDATATAAGDATATALTTATATTTGAMPVAPLVALARRSLPGLGGSTVTYASVVTTTKEAAENWLEPGSVAAAGSSPRAYVMVLSGRFVCQSCSRPPGASAPRGSSAQLVWVPGAGVSDFGLTPRVPAGLSHLGRVVRIYLGTPLASKVIPPPGLRRPGTPSRVLPVAPSRAVAPTAQLHVVPVGTPGMENGTPVH
jgi:hypothetical protein